MIKRAKKPSEYIPLFAKGNETVFQERLESNLIDSAAFGHMKSDDLDAFLTARQQIIKKDFRARVGAVTDVESKLDDDPGDLVDEVEEDLRNLIDKTLSEKESDYWNQFVPQGVRDRVTEKLKQHNGRHPGEVALKRTGFDKLCFCDIMDYHEIITSNANWAVFESRFGRKQETDKHFGNLKEYRNCIKHSRPMNNVIKKQGEASLEWIYSLLKAGM